MYLLNTQLAYFKYRPELKRMIVNIKWFRIHHVSELTIQAIQFDKAELDQLQSYIIERPINFPGNQFVERSHRENIDIRINKELSKNSLPLYLILSKEPVLNLDNIIYNAMEIVLTDKNYQFTVDYKLDFDVIGKIEIYKELRV